MNLFKFISYAIVWSLVQLTSRTFYSKIFIRNRKNLRRERATILVYNHPNTLFDPMISAASVNQFVHFLANAGLFKNAALGWFLGNTFGIKVERPEDVNGKRLKNDEAFKLAEEFLAKGGCLSIAPEGGSDIPRRIRRLKTGTARIALSTENKNDFKVGLDILPIGLNYFDQTSFQTQVVMNVGEPIHVADYEASYRKDDFEGALEITAEIEKRLKELTIDTRDDEEDAFLRKLEEICQTENPLRFDKTFDRSKKLLSNWRTFQESQSVNAQQFETEVQQYFSFLEKNKLRDKIVVKTQKANSKINWLMRTVFMIIGFPIFIYGWANNFLANFIPGWIFKISGLHVAYTSAVKAGLGIFTYLIFYGLQIWLVKYFFDESWVVWGYFVSLILTGLFAWWYKDFAKDTWNGWKLFNHSKKEFLENLEKRKSIVKILNTLLLDKVKIV